MMTVELFCGDCLDVLPTMEADSIDTAITDPPYGLEFMGKDWDHGVPGVRFWQEILRVCKPGAMLLAFGGTRTHHRLMCAIEDAGWEIRDCLMWLYGSGFPKSHDISKAIDKAAGAEREVVGPNKYAGRRVEGSGPDNGDNCYGQYNIPDGETAPATLSAQLWHGWGTALKPAWEPIIVAMKPRDGTFAHNALEWGVAGLYIDGGRIAHVSSGDLLESERKNQHTQYRNPNSNRDSYSGSFPSRYDYSGSAGRWPANLILDDEAGRLLDEQSGYQSDRPARKALSGEGSGSGIKGQSNVYGNGRLYLAKTGYQTEGGASRFFQHCNWGEDDIRFAYVPKASRRERTCDGEIDNRHCTVKPIALMRYLVKLTKTPTGGVVLDPFMGSGTTGIACVMEGREFIGIDQDKDSLEIAKRRIEHAQNQERQLELAYV